MEEGRREKWNGGEKGVEEWKEGKGKQVIGPGRELKGLIGDKKGQRSGNMSEEQGVGERREDWRKGKSEEKRGGRGARRDV